MWESEAAIAQAFWYLGPFVSIFLLLLVGAAIGGVIDSYFAGKVEDGLRADYEAAHTAHLSCIDYAKELEVELAKFTRKRGKHGRFVSDEINLEEVFFASVPQADGDDS